MVAPSLWLRLRISRNPAGCVRWRSPIIPPHLLPHRTWCCPAASCICRWPLMTSERRAGGTTPWPPAMPLGDGCLSPLNTAATRPTRPPPRPALTARWTHEALDKYARSARSEAPYLPSNIQYIANNNGLEGKEDVRADTTSGPPPRLPSARHRDGGLRSPARCVRHARRRRPYPASPSDTNVAPPLGCPCPTTAPTHRGPPPPPPPALVCSRAACSRHALASFPTPECRCPLPSLLHPRRCAASCLRRPTWCWAWGMSTWGRPARCRSTRSTASSRPRRAPPGGRGRGARRRGAGEQRRACLWDWARAKCCALGTPTLDLRQERVHDMPRPQTRLPPVQMNPARTFTHEVGRCGTLCFRLRVGRGCTIPSDGPRAALPTAGSPSFSGSSAPPGASSLCTRAPTACPLSFSRRRVLWASVAPTCASTLWTPLVATSWWGAPCPSGTPLAAPRPSHQRSPGCWISSIRWGKDGARPQEGGRAADGGPQAACRASLQ